MLNPRTLSAHEDTHPNATPHVNNTVYLAGFGNCAIRLLMKSKKAN